MDKIFIGADHNGYYLKQDIIEYLSKRYQVIDTGGQELDPNDDFTDFAAKVAHQVLSTDGKGILICGSGQGMVMAANRFKGIRAGLAYDVNEAKMIRRDEDANVCCLPARALDHDDQKWQAIIDAFFVTEFADAPRYRRRNNKLDQLG